MQLLNTDGRSCTFIPSQTEVCLFPWTMPARLYRSPSWLMRCRMQIRPNSKWECAILPADSTRLRKSWMRLRESLTLSSISAKKTITNNAFRRIIIANHDSQAFVCGDVGRLIYDDREAALTRVFRNVLCGRFARCWRLSWFWFARTPAPCNYPNPTRSFWWAGWAATPEWMAAYSPTTILWWVARLFWFCRVFFRTLHAPCRWKAHSTTRRMQLSDSRLMLGATFMPLDMRHCAILLRKHCRMHCRVDSPTMDDFPAIPFEIVVCAHFFRRSLSNRICVWILFSFVLDKISNISLFVLQNANHILFGFDGAADNSFCSVFSTWSVLPAGNKAGERSGARLVRVTNLKIYINFCWNEFQ